MARSIDPLDRDYSYGHDLMRDRALDRRGPGILGPVLIGTVLGFASAATLWSIGYSLLVMLAVYSGIGSVTMVTTAFLIAYRASD